MLPKEREVKERLNSLAGWKLDPDGKSIEKECEYHIFMEGIEFVNKVTKLAEEQEHHSGSDNLHARIRLSLTANDEGGLTE